MLKLNRLTVSLAVAAIVLLTHSEAHAQTLQFANPLLLTITGGSGATSSQVNVTLSTGGNPAALNLLSTSVNTSSQWLCANANSNILTVSAGTACPGYNSQLSPGTYSGAIIFNGAGATNTAQLTVTLTVTSASTGSGGLVATPSTLAFNVSAGSGLTTQTPTITLNGSPEQISGVSWSTVSGQTWLSASTPFTGSLTVSVNTAFLSNANDSGTILITTPAGQVSIPVTISTSGGGASGLSASPSTLSFNVSVGSGLTQQTFSVLQNGSPAAVTNLSASTTTGASWLQPFISGVTGQVTAQVNPSSPSSLPAGSYTGTVFVTTASGSVQVSVTLNVGSTSSSGLSASVNPVTFSLPLGSGISTQYVNINLNGQPITLTGISSSTTTGQTWLTASISGSTGQVAVTVNPANLNTGGTYQGSVFVSTTAGSASFGVTLNLGGGSTSGLVASPSSVNFNIPLIGSAVAPQNVSITLNGAAEPIQSVTYTLNTGQNWLLVSNTGTGALTVSTNAAAFTTAGTYNATITVSTSFGTLTIPVSTVVGSGSTSGLAATPNPLTLNVPTGSGILSQNLSVTYNGGSASITGVSSSTTTGQSWLQATTGSQLGTVLVTVNPAAVASGVAGSYSGTLFISTTAGQLSVQVTMNVGSSGSTAGLSANPNPVSFNAVAGGASSSQNVSITYNGSSATIVSVNASTTTGQSWLQPSYFSGSPGSVTVLVNPSLLSSAGTYTGTVTVNTTAGTTSFQVNLVIGGAAATTGGLLATPNPVNFTEATAGQTSSQNIVVTLNGVQQMVTSTTFANTPILSPTFVNTAINPDGSVTLTLNNVVTTPGFYQGKLTLYTTSGSSITVPVTLTFGSGGVSTGLAASPAALSLSASFGVAPSAQSVSITYNGSPIGVTAVSATTTTGQNWLQPAYTQSATGVVTVTVNPASLSSSGSYSGTVLVSTAAGSVSFGVTLNLGGGGTSGLAASPSSLNFSIPLVGTAVAPQNVSITLNGVAEPIQSVTYTLNSGQNWLFVSNAGTGIVTVSTNGSALTSAANYSATVTVNTAAGVVTIPVSVTVGGAGGTSGLIATPNPLTLNLPIGSGISNQSIGVTYNGVSASITSVSSSTTTGQTWLQASVGGQQGTVFVTVNPGAVSPGIAANYSGTVFIATTLGQLSVPVNMNITFGGTSQTATISSLSPSSAPAGGQPFTLTVNGSGFVTGSIVQWNGAQLSTSFVSGNQLIAPVPASLLVSPGSVSVTVLSSGAPSNALTFTVSSSTPTISSLSPASASAGGAAFTLTVNGSGFVTGSTVQWSGVPLSTSFISGNQLSASVPASLIGSQGVANIAVFSPVGPSNIVTFTVTAASAPAPSLASLSSNSAAAGGPAFSLTLNGTGFLPGSTAQWNGSPLTTTYINGTQVTATVGAALIANPGSASVTLANPGGSVSNALTFTIGAAGSGLIIVTASPLPTGSVGAPYTQGLSVTGGATPYKGLAIVAGSLPPGISLTALGGVLTGLLNGDPTTPGVFSFTVQVTDNANATTTKQFTLTINGSGISITAAGILNAASFQGGSVAPGEIVVIVGSGFGPATFVGQQLDSRGNVSTLLAGTQVLFDGIAAPLGYAESGLVSAVVPYEVSGKSSTQVQVVYAGQSSNSVAVPVTATMPGLFTSDGTGHGQGLITNQDGTVNSVSNPSPPGSIVFVYGTGEGQTTPNGVDGQPDGSPPPVPVAQPVTATIGGVDATVLYAGGVPGIVPGVLELEIQIPSGIAANGSVPVLITIGGSTTQANVTLAVGGGGS